MQLYLDESGDTGDVKNKSKGRKVYFENTLTGNNLGVQISDLSAGYINGKRENKEDVNFKNIIKYKKI